MPGDTRSIIERMAEARDLEKQGNITTAVKAYKAIIASDFLNAEAYNRLMIIYRKEKDYTKEISIIQRAIKAFEQQYEQALKDKQSENNKAVTLSGKLAKYLGLLTSEGKPAYEDPQISAWKKRGHVANRLAKK